MKLSDKTLKAIEALRPLFHTTRRCLITVHRDPDTDAIGSALAWAGFMDQLGIDSVIWAADTLEGYLHFLPGLERVQRTFDPDTQFDVIWALDCASFERIRNHEQLSPLLALGCPLVNIDHHADNTLFGDYCVVTTISSVGEFLVQIAAHFEWTLTPEIAECLYAAISFDTGRFLYSNTTADTFEAVTQLVNAGVNPGDLGRRMFETVPIDAFTVLNVALSRLVMDKERRLIYTSLPADVGPETIKVVDFIRQVDGADVVCVFRELADGNIRVNLRSKGAVVVNQIAHFFGGGGHEKAAGISIEGPLDSAMERVLTHVRSTLDAL
jgi:phosphoesterase RecJ-like protein